jgi:hypothetical protein
VPRTGAGRPSRISGRWAAAKSGVTGSSIICGFNIAVLIGAFMAVSRPVLGPRRSVLLAIAGVVLNTLRGGEVSLSVLANSGSNQSTSDAWLAALNPQQALISVGAGNPEGNAAPVVLAMMLSGRKPPCK